MTKVTRISSHRDRRFVRAAVCLATVWVALLVLSVGPGAATGAAQDTQEFRCSVAVSAPESGGNYRVDFTSNSSLNFIQAPGWEFTVTSPDHVVIASDSRPDGSPGSLFFDANGLPGGDYQLTVRASGNQRCSTIVTIAGAARQVPQIELRCPDQVVEQGIADLSAIVVYDGSESLQPVWILPNGAEFATFGLRVQLGDPGELEFEFELRDADGHSVRAEGCSVSVVPLPAATVPSIPLPTATPVLPPPTALPASPIPAPTSTPVPVPSSTPRPASTVTPVPAPPPAPSATPVPVPTSTPTEQDSPQDEQDEQDSQQDPEQDTTDDAPPPDDSAIAPSDAGSGLDPDEHEQQETIAGLLTATWPKTMAVGDTEDVTIELDGVAWRQESSGEYSRGYRLVMSGTTFETREFAVFGYAGSVSLELVLSPHLALVERFANEPPVQVQTVQFDSVGPDMATWRIEAMSPGAATIEIRSEDLRLATVGIERTQDEIQAIPISGYERPLFITVTEPGIMEQIADVAFDPLDAIPVALLPMAGVGALLIGSRRRDEEPDAPTTPAKTATVVMPRPAPPGSRDLGLILSGGGTRASAFSLGVVMSLFDQRRYHRVGQIGSVSGGSLTNGYLAGLRHKFGRYPTMAEDVRPLIRRIARGGLPLERSTIIFGASTVLAIVWIGFVMSSSAASAFVAISGTIALSLAFVGVTWLIYSWMGVRLAVERWLPNFLDASDDLTLGQLGSDKGGTDIDHVFTSTAPGASHVHLSNRRSVIDPLPAAKAAHPPAVTETGSADSVTMINAVQASAAFPGLPHVRISAEDMGFATVKGTLSLRDGGTVDNLGHIGATLDTSSADGADYRRSLTEWHTIDRWIVVDSSAEVERRTQGSGIVSRLLEFMHIGFAADLAEIASTGAASTTHARAQQVTDQFLADSNGMYLHLRQSPVEVCLVAMGWHADAPDQERTAIEPVVAAILSGQGVPADYVADERQRRAADMLQALRQAESGDIVAKWAARSRRNTGVPTTLSSLGAERTARLLHHGFVLATVNGVLTFDWGIPAPIQLSQARFTALVGD